MTSVLVTLAIPARAKEIQFGGYNWRVRSGRGGPGPNSWAEDNVWLDSSTNLHLKISQHDGKWSCAEITMQKRLGFGRYQFKITGWIDRFDPNVVLGLFNYPTDDVGSDSTHEIDIEFARWGSDKNPIGNFTVWPVEKLLSRKTESFQFGLARDQTTQRFIWSRTQVQFQSLSGYREDDQEVIRQWIYCPKESARYISDQPMPVHINLWLFQGRKPTNGQEVEIVLQQFNYTPESSLPGNDAQPDEREQAGQDPAEAK